jgi:hypothetical protein
MAKYQVYFDTQAGWKSFRVDIDEYEALDTVLPDILYDLEQNGCILQGSREGSGDISVTWEGRELDQRRPLPLQGVKPNDNLRIAVKTEEPAIQIHGDRGTIDVVKREELREGDHIVIGKTTLRFHTRKYEQLVSQNTTFIERFQQGRSLKQTVYFMSLVGGIAGLACWFVLSLIVLASPVLNRDSVNYPLLGAFIGGLSVGFSDHWLGDRVVGRFVLVGVVVGILAGAIGGLVAWPIGNNFGQYQLLARALAWMIAGALIGFAVSLRWFSVNKSRVLHGLMGGLFGGLLGGLAQASLIKIIGGPPAQALGLMLTGVGIGCAISLAPILLRQGILEFATSSDAQVLRKYAQNRKQWDLHDDGKYIIGSLGPSHSQTLFTPEVQIFVPDKLVAQRHAVLSSKRGRYYLEPHPSLGVSFPRELEPV